MHLPGSSWPIPTDLVIDHSVYPDVEHGEGFEDDYDRADYVQRICAACDFGVPPDRDTVALFRGWRDVFDRFPLLDSPSYHALRALSLARCAD